MPVLHLLFLFVPFCNIFISLSLFTTSVTPSHVARRHIRNDANLSVVRYIDYFCGVLTISDLLLCLSPGTHRPPWMGVLVLSVIRLWGCGESVGGIEVVVVSGNGVDISKTPTLRMFFVTKKWNIKEALAKLGPKPATSMTPSGLMFLRRFSSTRVHMIDFMPLRAG